MYFHCIVCSERKKWEATQIAAREDGMNQLIAALTRRTKDNTIKRVKHTFKPFFAFFVVFLLLVIVCIVLTHWVPMLQCIRIVFGGVFLLFAPGYTWSHVFWQRHVIGGLERFTLSLAISLILVPLVVYLVNRIGTAITTAHSIAETAGIIVAAMVVLFVQRSSNVKQKKITQSTP